MTGGDFGHVPLDPAHDRARMMQIRRRVAAARKHKAVEGRQSGVEPIDLLFDPGNLVFIDPKRFNFPVLPLRASQIAAEIKQIILKPS